MKRIVMYDNEVHADADIEDGERVELIHGNGIREGESMGFAVAVSHPPATSSLLGRNPKRVRPLSNPRSVLRGAVRRSRLIDT